MKRILVPTDFSSHAENALKTAAQIAKKTNSEIHLLHIIETPNQMNDALTASADIPEVMLYIKKATETLDSIREQGFLENITVTESIRFERVFKGIISYTNENETDLIVMGSHGISGIEEILLGSNTERIVRLANVPVLVIKKDNPYFNPSKIVFASDFSDEIKEPFKKLLKFAKIYNSKISMLTICTPNSFKPTSVTNKIMQEFTNDLNIENLSFHIYNDTNIEKGIINFSNEINADLISICTHGRTGLSHFFTGSISEDLANHAARPLLVYKIHKK